MSDQRGTCKNVSFRDYRPKRLPPKQLGKTWVFPVLQMALILKDRTDATLPYTPTPNRRIWAILASRSTTPPALLTGP